jgi:hypothetical protein
MCGDEISSVRSLYQDFPNALPPMEKPNIIYFIGHDCILDSHSTVFFAMSSLHASMYVLHSTSVRRPLLLTPALFRRLQPLLLMTQIIINNLRIFPAASRT